MNVARLTALCLAELALDPNSDLEMMLAGSRERRFYRSLKQQLLDAGSQPSKAHLLRQTFAFSPLQALDLNRLDASWIVAMLADEPPHTRRLIQSLLPDNLRGAFEQIGAETTTTGVNASAALKTFLASWLLREYSCDPLEKPRTRLGGRVAQKSGVELRMLCQMVATGPESQLLLWGVGGAETVPQVLRELPRGELSRFRSLMSRLRAESERPTGRGAEHDTPASQSASSSGPQFSDPHQALGLSLLAVALRRERSATIVQLALALQRTYGLHLIAVHRTSNEISDDQWPDRLSGLLRRTFENQLDQ